MDVIKEGKVSTTSIIDMVYPEAAACVHSTGKSGNGNLCTHWYACSMQDRIAGYALSGGGRGIERVDISVDGAYSKLDSKAIGITNGVVLVTYSSLIASSEKGHSYLQQLVQWCGSEFDGLLVFDEVKKDLV